MTFGAIFISIIFMVIGMAVQARLKSKFSEYSQLATASGLSGKEVAEKMLRDNGIYDVQVTSVEGALCGVAWQEVKKSGGKFRGDPYQNKN